MSQFPAFKTVYGAQALASFLARQEGDEARELIRVVRGASDRHRRIRSAQAHPIGAAACNSNGSYMRLFQLCLSIPTI